MNGLDPEPMVKSGSAGYIRKQVRELAAQKAVASAGDRQGLVLGSDTVVVLGRTVLGKPRDLEEAQEMLAKLSGKTHLVVTGVALYDTLTGAIEKRSSTSQVTFRSLTEGERKAYCARFDVLDKAGAYAIQDIGDVFVARFSGSLDTIIGLPMAKVTTLLKGYSII